MGQRRVVPVSGGSFEGSRLRGVVLPHAGSDWLLQRADGTFQQDVRLTLQTDDGVLHFHLLRLVGLAVTGGYRKPDWGLGATYAAALGALLLFYPACRWYRDFKARHPQGWARYV